VVHGGISVSVNHVHLWCDNEIGFKGNSLQDIVVGCKVGIYVNVCVDVMGNDN
ncbi:hypothetical protein HAX54_004622, partial [Datura stramonium]|nr:hypothetical protein [Datura stramonium]